MATLEDVQANVVGALIDYVYTATYSAPSGFDHDMEVSQDLPFHIAMYAAGDRFIISGLKEAATARFTDLYFRKASRVLNKSNMEELSENFRYSASLAVPLLRHEWADGLGRALIDIARDFLLGNSDKASRMYTLFGAVPELAAEVAKDICMRPVRPVIFEKVTKLKCDRVGHHAFLTKAHDAKFAEDEEFDWMPCPVCRAYDEDGYLSVVEEGEQIEDW